jgi:hypothetical protein
VKQPWPDRLTNRPYCRRIQCKDRMASYPDTRASVGKVEVTAAESSLRRNRKLRLARPWASASGGGLRLARPQGSAPASTSEGGLRLARPQGSASTLTSEGGLRLARPQGSASTLGGIASSPDPGLGLRRSLRLARPWARTNHATGGTSLPYP